MKKVILAAGTAALIAASGAVFAQTQGTSGPNDGQNRRGGQQLSQEDRASLLDARFAALKAGLKLTPDQEKLLPPVQDVVRKIADQRAERVTQMREERRQARQNNAAPDFAARLDRMAEMAQTRAENAKALADAVKPFYASLDERQKRLLPRLVRPLMSADGPAMRWGHRGRGN